LREGGSMKEKDEIYMDFKRAKQAADQLDAIAADLAGTSKQKLSSTMGNLNVTWKDAAAADFNKKSEVLQSNISQAISAIKSIAESIRNDARRMYEAEMRAYEIASRRDS